VAVLFAIAELLVFIGCKVASGRRRHFRSELIVTATGRGVAVTSDCQPVTQTLRRTLMNLFTADINQRPQRPAF